MKVSAMSPGPLLLPLPLLSLPPLLPLPPLLLRTLPLPPPLPLTLPLPLPLVRVDISPPLDGTVISGRVVTSSGVDCLCRFLTGDCVSSIMPLSPTLAVTLAVRYAQ